MTRSTPSATRTAFKVRVPSVPIDTNATSEPSGLHTGASSAPGSAVNARCVRSASVRSTRSLDPAASLTNTTAEPVGENTGAVSLPGSLVSGESFPVRSEWR